MINYTILIDSSSGYTEELAKSSGYEFVPLLMTLEKNNQCIEFADDGKSISNEEFYAYLQKSVIKTSQTPRGILINKWRELLKIYEHVFFVPISKGLSGQYQSAYALSQEDEFLNRVHVIDSEGVSYVNKKIINDIKRYLDNGDDYSELQNYVNTLKNQYAAFILPYQLDTLVSGGRVTRKAAKLAKFLKISPILEFHGNIDKFGKTRTFPKAIKECLKEIKKRFNSTTNGKLTLVNSKCDENLKEDIINLLANEGFNDPNQEILSNVITAHTGYNTFVIIYWA